MAESYSIAVKARDLLNSLLAIPADVSRGEERFYAAIAVTVPPALLVHAGYIFLFAYWAIWPLVIFNVFSVVNFTAAIIFVRQRRFVLATILSLGEVIVHSSLVIVFIGWGFGAQYLILVSFVGVATNTWSKRRMTVVIGLMYIPFFVGWYYYTEAFLPLTTPPSLQLAVINILNIVFTFLVVGGSLMYLVSEAEAANKANEDLLNNVLPRPIAARLKHDKSTIADDFQNASILFADLAGFTPMSQHLKPSELVEMLDTIFTRFDGLVDQYGLEKIKTIGDEYMVAAGIPIPREDHAEALANFAVAMRDSLADYQKAHGIDLQMRIGLNSGPVVAGVIGTRRFLYDLWGDSVNTASRMQSHGIAGEIHVTRATRDLLEGKYTFVDRGLVEIKGKGPIQTYLLRPNPTVAPDSPAMLH